MSNGKGVLVFVLIVAISSLGLSGYLLVDKFFLSPRDEPIDTGAILVGLWENLEKAPDNLNPGTSWYINLTEQEYLNMEFVELNLNNSEFRLSIMGIYKFTFTTLLVDCDPNANHWICLKRNGIIEHFIERTSIPTDPDDTFWYVSSTFYVFSSGEDTFNLYCYSADDPNGFRIYSDESKFNQLAIEFLK